MRRAGLIAAAAVVLAVAGCGSDSEEGSVPYRARSCAEWSQQMDGAERQEAAAQLLSGERDEDEVAGRGAPSQDAVKQFGGELGALCGQAGDDALLAGLADELYASNRAFYRL